MVCGYQYNEEKNEIRVNCMNCVYESSIEDSPLCMSRTIDKLMELKKPVRIIFAREREYEYDFEEARLLLQIGDAIKKLRNEDRIFSLENIKSSDCEKHVEDRYGFLQEMIVEIKSDPVQAYKKIKRKIRHIKIKKEKAFAKESECFDIYIQNALTPMKERLEECDIIKKAIPNLTKIKDRSFYRELFHPSIRPNFMYTRYMAIPPKNAEPVDTYNVGDTEVTIYKLPGKVRKLYHAVPPEFKLSDFEYKILDKSRRYLAQHQPRESTLTDPSKFRESLKNIGLDVLRDLSNDKIEEQRLEKLADILTRYTAGMGTIELLLKDPNVQDIEVNSPVGDSPIYIIHGEHNECETNFVPTQEDAEAWATKFRMQSGRPLDEANPVLDTELEVPGGRARVAAITRSLSPEGHGFAFRRHRGKPWTYPLFIKNNMINAFGAGLMWFLVDGSRSMLIAGTRSSGKTSFLGATMVQIMPKLRIISVEDTLELPVTKMRELGYNIERLKSRSVITRVETELPAQDALRTALRLGDSCLILGEVRSKEAKALYEAMRIGALANVVAGTIHGESAYGVFDRVVNDLGVPPTSFKATDIVLICNMLKSADGLSSFRRVVELTEVRKHWQKDPTEEGGFVNLMEYSAEKDELKPTDTLTMGESVVLNSIAERIRLWKGKWENVWNNIKLREKILKTLVDYSKKYKNPNLLEAGNVMESNNMFHIYSRDVTREVGAPDPKMIFNRWEKWLDSKV